MVMVFSIDYLVITKQGELIRHVLKFLIEA